MKALDESVFEAIFQTIPSKHGTTIWTGEEADVYLQRKYPSGPIERNRHLWLILKSKTDGALFFSASGGKLGLSRVGFAITTVGWSDADTLGYWWKPDDWGAKCDVCDIPYERMSLEHCDECGTCAECCDKPDHIELRKYRSIGT